MGTAYPEAQHNLTIDEDSADPHWIFFLSLYSELEFTGPGKGEFYRIGVRHGYGMGLYDIGVNEYQASYRFPGAEGPGRRRLPRQHVRRPCSCGVLTESRLLPISFWMQMLFALLFLTPAQLARSSS